MAKEKNQEVVAVTADNVVEQSKSGNVLTPELKKLMDEQTQKEKDERIINEVKRRITYIDYRFRAGLVNLKKMNAMGDLALYNTRQQGRLSRFLTGFVVTEKILNEYTKTEDDVLGYEKINDKNKRDALIISVPKTDKEGKIVREERTFKLGDSVPAIIDTNDFDDALEKLGKNLLERQRAIEKQFDSDMTVIKKNAGRYWNDSWMYNVKVINGTGTHNTSYYE